MAVDSTTKVIVRTTITARTTTRRAPRTGRLSSSAPKKPAMARDASRTSSHVPDSSVTASPRGYSPTSMPTRAWASVPRPDQRETGNRHPAQPAYRLSFRPDDRPEDAHPGEQDVAEADHEPDGRGEDGESGRIHEKVYLSPGPAGRIAPARAIGRTGSGAVSGTAGPYRHRRPLLASGSCGQVSDSTVLPGHHDRDRAVGRHPTEQRAECGQGAARLWHGRWRRSPRSGGNAAAPVGRVSPSAASPRR